MTPVSAAGPGVAHGEGTDTDTPPREEELVGTAGSHSPAPDPRAEEPAGEIAPSADTEGGVDE